MAETGSPKREIRKLLRAVPDVLRTRRDRDRGPDRSRYEAPVARRAPAPLGGAVTDRDVVERLTRLGALRDAGIVTPAEFETKKAELLGPR